METLFWRHSTPAQKRKGTCTIYSRVTIFGRRADLGSTGIKTYSDFWDQDRQQVSDCDPHASFKNEQLNDITSQLLGIYNEFLRKKQPLTALRVKEAYLRSDKPSTFMGAFSLFLKEYQEDESHEESSYKTLKNVKNLFGRFLVHSKQRDIILEDMTPLLMEQYATYMRKCKYEESYSVKSSRVIRQVVKWAKKKKLVSYDPMEDFSVKHEKKKKPIYLDTLQLTVWANHEFNNPFCQRAADLFVLYCRTGFHYQDLMQVIRDPEEYIRTGMDEKAWIYKPRQKTEVEAKVPIHKFEGLIDPIVNKYGGWGEVPYMTNKDLNGFLKLCAAEVNMILPRQHQIYYKLSVKHGRNTFCHHILNELAMDKERLITMLGRLSDTDLDVYVRPDEVGIITAFERIEKSSAA
jgi:hypothetical protein